MHNYNFLTLEDFKKKKLKILIENIIDEWKHPLYEIYTMSTGTLVHGEIGMASESMYNHTLEKTNKKIKNLITSMHTFNLDNYLGDDLNPHKYILFNTYFQYISINKKF